MALVIIHKFGKTPGISLGELAEELGSAFQVPVSAGAPQPLPPDGYDRHRHQYSAAVFIQRLLQIKERSPMDQRSAVLLGLTGADLFVPQLTFVFGLSDRRAGAAVVATSRLRPEFYGEEPDQAFFGERVLKEATHELGHVFGLPHCGDALCIMHFSNSIADTDRKGPGFCRKCRARLAELGIVGN